MGELNVYTIKKLSVVENGRRLSWVLAHWASEFKEVITCRQKNQLVPDYTFFFFFNCGLMNIIFIFQAQYWKDLIPKLCSHMLQW